MDRTSELIIYELLKRGAILFSYVNVVSNFREMLSRSSKHIFFPKFLVHIIF